ncbi:putative phosphatase regulatory subunit-domain-containing protein [Mycena capillaripes]|nr:putative phosphatase regulatory subunit-domain-containing protein [Mycena capillaripes]
MIATLAMSPSMDFRNSNTAGAPLPLLPRRSPSANRTTFPSTSITPSKTSPPIKLVVQHATPPDDPAGASSSSSSSSDGRPTLVVRAKRSLRPPEQSTPTPTPFPTRGPSPPRTADANDNDATPRPPARPLVYAPGAGIGGLRALSTSHLPAPSPLPSPPKPTDETPRMVRKKSGQPVKSSLKSSTPRVRGSLAVVIGTGSSKSAPSTPTQGARSVHFDTQLEHVKLFLAEQKPLAVSRDGSPTDDTSGTDGDFPDWIFGREEQGRLEMLVDVPPPPSEVDVKLQALALSDDGTSVTGTVAVRNLAFDKWVAVRFTFDDWQTTSEVTGRYSHSLPGGAVDVFSFSIRLNDLLARIEGKVMMLAVRYTSAGREMWDNNGGGDYRATFRRVRGEPKAKKEQEEAKAKSPEGKVAADLRSRLERVVKAAEAGPTRPVQLRAGAAAKTTAETADKFKAGGSLAARYDFGTSSRNPWRPHQRAASHPVDSPSPPSTIPWPTRAGHAPKARAVLGSPRDAAEDFRPAPYVASDNEDAPFSIASPVRNHQRGYFDVPLRDVGALRRTPPGTPRFRSLDDLTPLGSPGRFNSFPPLDPRLGVGLGLLEMEGRLTPRGAAREGSVSEESTPSFVSSEASSRSGTVSPVSPPDFVGLGVVLPVESPSNYHSFLDRFCFYTGPEASGVEGLPRTQSVSSVEEFLSAASASPRLHTLVQKLHAPVALRFDDPRSSSGSTTPTPNFAPASDSRSATPVAA